MNLFYVYGTIRGTGVAGIMNLYAPAKRIVIVLASLFCNNATNCCNYGSLQACQMTG